MRPAFTLVEVIAAAAIASIAGIALLNMNSQSMFLFSRLKETAETAETLSLVGNHADKRFGHTTKSLYDLLDNTYDIQNDVFRKWLQDQKYDYNEHVVETVSFGSDMNGSDLQEFSQDDVADAANAPVIQFELIQVAIKREGMHGAVLTARPLF